MLHGLLISSSWYSRTNSIWRRVQIMKLFIMQFSAFLLILMLLNILLSTLYSHALKLSSCLRQFHSYLTHSTEVWKLLLFDPNLSFRIWLVLREPNDKRIKIKENESNSSEPEWLWKQVIEWSLEFFWKLLGGNRIVRDLMYKTNRITSKPLEWGVSW
jgi:hypothetical protein